MLVTDGIFAFAMFIYKKIEWSSSTSNGGNSTSGRGGVSAQVDKINTRNHNIGLGLTDFYWG